MATTSPQPGDKRTPETDANPAPAKKQQLADLIEIEHVIVRQKSSGWEVKKLETSELAGTQRANNLLRKTILYARPEKETKKLCTDQPIAEDTWRRSMSQTAAPGCGIDTHEKAHSGSAAGFRMYHFAGDVDVVFKLFLAWLYTGSIPSSPLAGDKAAESLEFKQTQPRGRLVSSKSMTADNDEFEDFCLVQLIYFGTFLKVFDLSNAALSYLAARNERHQRSFAASAVQHAYKMSEDMVTSRLVDFMVDDSARRLNSDNLEPSIVDFPGAFVQRVLKLTIGRTTSKAAAKTATQWARRVCDAHFHTAPDMIAPCKKRCILPTDLATVGSIACNDYESTAFISVGSEAVLFPTHEQKLCQVSDYFQKALRGAFAEGGSKTIHLPEERVADFGLFLDWLYTGKLTFPESEDYASYRDYLEGGKDGNSEQDEVGVVAGAADDEGLPIRKRQDSDSSSSESDSDEEDENEDQDGSDDDSDDDSDDEEEVPDKIAGPSRDSASMQKRVNHDGWRFREILNLYIFADRRGVPALQNDIMDLIVDWRESGWSHMSSYLDLVNIAYDNLPAQSKLLDYLVEEAGYCWNHELSTIDRLEGYPKVFVAGSMRILLTSGRDQHRPAEDREEWISPDWREDICMLHEHVDDAEGISCEAAHNCWHEKMAEKGKGMEPVRPLP
ncbi:hypothetical protein LTR56_005453 [Elasticomyces elasticus]|nr:hypothetical protein LTR22_015271 [Elasticomyces elasticus]KAK3651943.1 hypothetical protein LTR56_005453 [Elasticomyces elasticus]KAK4927838.1 hypothetical protein LTR49_005465 [Elasticomyces elasticus]